MRLIGKHILAEGMGLIDLKAKRRTNVDDGLSAGQGDLT